MNNTPNRVVIREELVALTGSWRKALILDQFLYWTKKTWDLYDFLLEERGNESVKKRGWIPKRSSQLIDELMLDTTEPTIRIDIQALVNDGLLQDRRNPFSGFAKTLQYRINLLTIQERLSRLGYVLNGYPVLSDESYNNLDDDQFTEYMFLFFETQAESYTHYNETARQYHERRDTEEQSGRIWNQRIDDGSGVVYLIYSEGRYKIDCTYNMKMRMIGYRHMDVHVIHTITTNNKYWAEKQMHQRFQSKRINQRAEWFNLDSNDVADFCMFTTLDKEGA